MTASFEPRIPLLKLATMVVMTMKVLFSLDCKCCCMHRCMT